MSDREVQPRAPGPLHTKCNAVHEAAAAARKPAIRNGARPVAALASAVHQVATMKHTALLGLSLTLLTFACSEPESPQGFALVRADETSVSATYDVDSTHLVVTGALTDGVAQVQIAQADGVVLTALSMPEDRFGGDAERMRLEIDAAAAAATARLAPYTADTHRLIALAYAYRGISEGLLDVLPPGSALRSVAGLQATVLTTSVLQSAPAAAAEIDHAIGAAPIASGYATGALQPNDDGSDANAEPTWEITFDATGTTTAAYRLAVYGGSGVCAGACGPGCDWCVRIGNYNVCETNWFCQWHDAHCGAWEHFFDCH